MLSSSEENRLTSMKVEPGISITLARHRAEIIRDVHYDLAFEIPRSQTSPVTGNAAIHFTITDKSVPITLDFKPGSEFLDSVKVNGRDSHYTLVPDHIIVPVDELSVGPNTIEITFTAGDDALNRNPDFLYTLFVPARAHFTFPCFDQPDLKARFTLGLTLPTGWQAVSSAGAEIISTYLFAFAAGEFKVESAQVRGRSYRMFHRETDAIKVSRNRDAIFELHASALGWLEDYTAISYPFSKFDFVLIPSFQFGGMEHPGAIFYNASALLLEESATENQILNRASLIAHETAHMWFGDLVTMRWFNDVWLKEVFANFMAAKIVHPSFPSIDHDLRFLVSHYPPAYAVDRTGGTHAIRQDLDNLNDAGSLYGAIIYQKAPIVMRQLEQLLGTQRFQAGVRAYLEHFKFSNAAWPDLVKEFDRCSDIDVAAWSHAWIEKAGRPKIPMQLEMDTRTFTGGGLAYGDFVLESASRDFLMQHLEELGDPLTRGAAWITLWEELLDRRVSPEAFMNLALRALPKESTEQIVQLVLTYCRDAFWKFLSADLQQSFSLRLEQVIRTGFTTSKTSSLKATYFSAFHSIVQTLEGVQMLERIWHRQEQMAGLNLSEDDDATIAAELAVRSISGADAILQAQSRRFTNPDRKARFDFVMPAVSSDLATREAWFARIADVRNRHHERWVLEGLRYLHHPLRSAESLKHIRPALEMLEEIQRTGDIFFPKSWVDATLNGHNTREAAEVVRSFLSERKDYPPHLRRIILQSADNLFRAIRN